MAIQSSDEFMNPNYKDTRVKEDNKNENTDIEPNVSKNTGKIESNINDSDNLKEQQEQSDTQTDNLSVQDSDNSTEKTEESDTEKPTNEQRETTEEQSEDLTPEAKNFNALRQLKKKAERERDLALRKYREMELSSNSNQQKTKSQVDEADLNIDPDDLIEGKHFNQMANEIKKVKRKLNQYENQTAAINTEAKLKAKYSDFDDVVTPENLEILVQREPDLAHGLNSNPDLYSKAITAYTMIKELKIYTAKQNKKLNNTRRDNRKIDENLSRPQVAASVAPQAGNSPLSKVNQFSGDLTQDQMDLIYQDMVKKASGN